MSNTFVITEPGMTSLFHAQLVTMPKLQAYCTRTGFVANEDFKLKPYTEELQYQVIQRQDNSSERDYIRKNYKKIDLYVQ
jgi:hypothetical protein